MSLKDRLSTYFVEYRAARKPDELQKAEDQALASIKKDIEDVLPNSQNGTSRVFTADLHGSAMGEGYKLALKDVRERLERYIG